MVAMLFLDIQGLWNARQSNINMWKKKSNPFFLNSGKLKAQQV